MESVACDLCGSTRQTVIYQVPDRRYFPNEWFTVVECDECGLGFVNPRPSPRETQKYYPPEYFEEECVRHRDHHQRRYAREARYLQEIETRGRAPWKLLDVGCANGDFPRFMKARGWYVEGVEVSVSTQFVDDFRVYRQPFPDIPVNDPTYDAVTAWAVLEHVHNPRAHFQKASAVIKPGGVFVFLVTNFNSLASRRLFSEDVPRHLYFFSQATVKRYLEATGFRLEKAHYRRHIFRMPPANWLSFLVKTRLKGEPFSYRDLPLSRPEFIARRGLKPGLLSSLRFALANPWKVVDRALWPTIEAIQILRKNYGVVTFVGRKGLIRPAETGRAG